MDSTGTFPREHIYIATSWRNTLQPSVVKILRAAGYAVYDFREPGEGKRAFAWSEIVEHGMQNHDSVPASDFLDAMETDRVREGFDNDYRGMQDADIFVLLLPCERDAHLELGWAVGAGKETHIVLDDPCKASLMYQMVDHIHANVDSLLRTLGVDDGD